MRWDRVASPWEDRLVEVWAPPEKAGAGLAISAFGVLTARHVVEAGLLGGVQVRIVSRERHRPSPWVPARVVGDDPGWDLAVLVVDEGSRDSGEWPVPASPPPVGAMPGRWPQQDCAAVGFPGAEVQTDVPGDQAGELRQTEQIYGTLLPMGQARQPVTPDLRLPQRWMPLDVGSATPMHPDGWGGMSGAGVLLADGRLTGVVVSAEWEHQQRRLYVVALGEAVRGSRSLVAAMNDVAASGLAQSLQQLIVLHRPPDLVPSTFFDRGDVLNLMLKKLKQPSRRFVALVGDHGIGKTAAVTELLQRLSGPDPEFRITTFEYISTRGNRPVNVPTLIEVLAKAHPDASVREPLLRRVRQPGSSWWEKLDDVIRALGSCRVLIVVDNCERLLDRRGEIAERSLRELVEYLSKHPDHAVQLLFVTSAWPKFRLRGFSPADSLPIPVDLSPDDGVDFLRRLAPAGVDDDSLTRLYGSAGGRARTLELLSGMLAESNGDVTRLIRTMRGVRRDRMAPALLDRIVASLPESDAWVLRVLAVFGRPVPGAAVSALLERDCQESLARLSDLRFVRVDESAGTHYLPPDEAEHLAGRIEPGEPADRTRAPRPRTTMALRHHAAGYFEALAAEADVRRVEDLTSHFGEIELLTSGGEFDRAFRLMNSIENEYLIAWGHTDALSQFRKQVVGHLGKAHYEVDNLIRMAVAMSRQEDYDGALNTLRRARRRNYDVRKGDSLNSELQFASNELAITLNIAGTRFDSGQVTKAATLYQSALRNPMLRRSVVREAKAHSGVGLCLTEIADFDEAIRNFELGLALIEDSQDDQATELRPRLMLNMGVCELYRGRANEALTTLRNAQSLAQGLQDRVLAAKCVDAQALATIDTDDRRALALATEAAAVGTQTGSPELARETNNTLALIHLRLRQIPEARAAANVAVEFGRTRRGLAGFAMLGIALLRDREPELAEGAFLKAHVRASELLLKEKNAYQLREFDGLALTGLALSAGSDECLQLAQAAYCRARRRTRASGVVQLCLQKLNALLDGNSDPEFDRIRAAAKTGKTQG